MRSLAPLAMVALAITCGPSPDAKLPGYTESTGGETSTGVGGATNTGGTSSIGTGGSTGTGGSSVVGTGGTTGSGGRIGTGGGPGSGGRLGADAGRDSATSPDGRGTDGRIPGTGGSLLGTGGVGGGGATKGTGGGGGAATGGITGTRDAAAPPDSAGTCISQVVSNGYACGSTPACSACKDQNGNSREAGCQKAIDCLAAAGASCNSSCKQDCLNQAGDTPAMACVTALQTAACSASGCGETPPNGGG